MFFSGKFRTCQNRPQIYGSSVDVKNKNSPMCHEFLSVSDVKIEENKTVAEFTLVAGPYVTCSISKGTMFGPASTLRDKTLIYPCDRHRCRIPCPCQICRRKETFCHKPDHRKSSGDCRECRQDFDDHSIFHRAFHSSCKFCLNIHEVIPVMKFVIRDINGYWPHSYEVYNHAWLFEHWNCVSYPEKNELSKYPCNKCEETFKSKFDLKRHEQTQHFGLKFDCSCCGMQFSREDNLRQHIRRIHKIIPESKKESTHHLQCDDCRVTFFKKSHLESHLKITKKQCDLCSINFCTFRQVQQHKLKQHSNFSCEHCKKSFPDKANLMRHTQRSRNEDNSLKNECQICSKTFCVTTKFLKHKKSHPKQPIECDYCKKKFSTKWWHGVHLSKRQENNCKQCGLMACSVYDLKVHVNAVHLNSN